MSGGAANPSNWKRLVYAGIAVAVLGAGGGAAKQWWAPHGSPVQGGGGGGGVTFTANVFVAPDGTSGATTSCTASASAIDYPTALAASHVCQGNGSTTTGFDNACSATASLSSASGATIGVKSGTYVGASANQGYILGGGIDCSGGKGGNYNPNAVEQSVSAGSTTGWVTLACADGDSSPVEFNDQTLGRGSVQIYGANLHLIFSGSCYHFDETLYTSPSGGAYATNLQFVGTSQATPMVMFNVNIPGGTNILLKNVSVSGVACGKIDVNVASALRCRGSGVAWYESEWANYGSASASCSSSNATACGGSLSLGAPDAGEPYVHGTYSNVRLQNILEHDQISVCSNGSCQHPGCLLTGDDGVTHTAADLVVDHLVCERVAVQGIELHSNGTVVQNSVFACPVNELDTSGGVWGQCRSGGYSIGLGADASTLTNVLVRHNSFFGGTSAAINIGFGAAGGYSNVRIIGNIVGGTGVSNCGTTGITAAYNSFWNGTTACGTNSETLASDPFTDSNPGTTQIAGTTSQVDPALTGSPAVQTVPNAGSPNADYTLALDATGGNRSGTSSEAGAVGP